eukprot:355375-Chlamydomonas_euryale.AAC.3
MWPAAGQGRGRSLLQGDDGAERDGYWNKVMWPAAGQGEGGVCCRGKTVANCKKAKWPLQGTHAGGRTQEGARGQAQEGMHIEAREGVRGEAREGARR